MAHALPLPMCTPPDRRYRVAGMDCRLPALLLAPLAVVILWLAFGPARSGPIPPAKPEPAAAAQTIMVRPDGVLEPRDPVTTPDRAAETGAGRTARSDEPNRIIREEAYRAINGDLMAARQSESSAELDLVQAESEAREAGQDLRRLDALRKQQMVSAVVSDAAASRREEAGLALSAAQRRLDEAMHKVRDLERELSGSGTWRR